MTQYVLKDYKKSKLIVAALWAIYAGSYFIRTCYAAAIGSIVSEGNFNKGEVGLIGTAFFVCYGVGQLISGLIGDRVNPFFMILFGSAAGSICCFFMPFAADLPVLILIWGANGYFQSMLWSPILRVFSETIDKTLQKKAVLNISLSLPIGTICSFLVSTVIIKYLKWEYVFIGGGTAAMLCTLLSLLVILYCKRSIKKINRIAADKPEAKTENPAKKNILSIMLMSGLFLIIFPSFLHGMLRDGIANWVPTMISELFGVSPSFSVILTIVLPIFNSFGAYAVVPLYKKLGQNEMKTAAVIALIALIPLVIMLFYSHLSVYFIAILLAATTSVMYALNYLIISLVPVHFTKFSCTSSISGILNSFAHIGCALSTYGFGAVSESRGWKAVIFVWIAAAVLTSVFSALADRKWSKFIRKA